MIAISTMLGVERENRGRDINSKQIEEHSHHMIMYEDDEEREFN
jgi:hypothetical protein